MARIVFCEEYLLPQTIAMVHHTGKKVVGHIDHQLDLDGSDFRLRLFVKSDQTFISF